MLQIKRSIKGYYLVPVCDECKEECNIPGTVVVPDDDNLGGFVFYCERCANYLCVAGVSLKFILTRLIDDLH